MSKYKYSETERQINSVLKHQDEDLKSIHFPSLSEADATVAKADALLRRLGYQPDAIKGLVPVQPRKTMVIPTWEQCCAEAETHVGTDCELESLFTEEELRSNELAIKQLNEEFNAVHRLDAFDISIAALAGLVGAAVDILLVGIPQKTPDGLKGGPFPTTFETTSIKNSQKKKCRNLPIQKSARFLMMPRIIATQQSVWKDFLLTTTDCFNWGMILSSVSYSV